jgi:hypothetical protein
MARSHALFALLVVSLLCILAHAQDDFNATLSASTRLKVRGKEAKFKLIGANDSYIEVSFEGAREVDSTGKPIPGRSIASLSAAKPAFAQGESTSDLVVGVLKRVSTAWLACSRARLPNAAAVKPPHTKRRRGPLHLRTPTKPKKNSPRTKKTGNVTINGAVIPYVELRMNLTSLLAGAAVTAKVAACPGGAVSAFAAVGATAAPEGSIAIKAFYDIKNDTVFPYGAGNNIMGGGFCFVFLSCVSAR